jgi:DNA-binding NarL/FixJ family response regulator
MGRTRVLLADDNADNAELLRELLQGECDVVGSVQDGHALVAAADSLSPDVIVTDIGMPGLDGIDAAHEILRRHPGTRLVFVTVYDDPAVVARGMAAGASGYVLKNTAGEELLPAVRAAARGERQIGRDPQQPGSHTPSEPDSR